MQIRPYQADAIGKLREQMAAGHKRLILCAPTGAGKTVMFTTMVQAALKRGKKCLIVTDRIELLSQAGGALERLGLKPQRIQANTRVMDSDNQLYTAMVETLERRADKEPYRSILNSCDLVIFDEAHKRSFDKIVKHLPSSCYIIGATATPVREGSQQPLKDVYTTIVESVNISELVEAGYLARPHIYGLPVDLSKIGKRGGEYDLDKLAAMYSEKQVYVGVVANYLQHTPNKKSICFTPNLASSKQITQEFNDNGVPCRHIDGYMDATERALILNWFAKTPNAVICNMGILTTGFDAPDIEVVILYRATTSVALYLQMCGRGSRVTPAKKDFYIMDFGDNVRRHGFWSTDRNWSLDVKIKQPQPPPMKHCSECNAILYASAKVCKECGTLFPEREKTTVEVFAELALLEDKQEVWNLIKASAIEQRAAAAKAGLVSPYRIVHNLRTYSEVAEFMRHMGWKPAWWHHNRHRFPNIKC